MGEHKANNKLITTSLLTIQIMSNKPAISELTIILKNIIEILIRPQNTNKNKIF